MRNAKARKKRTISKGRVEKIASILEKRLAEFPAAIRDAKLNEIHRIASATSRPPSERVPGLPRTPESRLSARPREES